MAQTGIKFESTCGKFPSPNNGLFLVSDDFLHGLRSDDNLTEPNLARGFVGSVGLVEFVGFVDLPVSPVFTPVFCGIEDCCGRFCEGMSKESTRYVCSKNGGWLSEGHALSSSCRRFAVSNYTCIRNGVWHRG